MPKKLPNKQLRKLVDVNKTTEICLKYISRSDILFAAK